MKELSHLDKLEAEAIYILREVAAPSGRKNHRFRSFISIPAGNFVK